MSLGSRSSKTDWAKEDEKIRSAPQEIEIEEQLKTLPISHLGKSKT